MSKLSRLKFVFFSVLAALIPAAGASAQELSEKAMAADSSGGYGWLLYVVLALAMFGCAFYLLKRSRQSAAKVSTDDRSANAVISSRTKQPTSSVRPGRRVDKPNRSKVAVPTASAETTAATRAFQDKMRKFQYSRLPVHTFIQITGARPFTPLEVSLDPGLLSAIEQSQDEFEEDEAVREIAVRVLAAFRTKNSIEALSQVALYDLSSNIRSKAVTILADFDHETVFETMLLACADPTREVRAAAARGLFRLSFDRAESWKRIIDTGDQFRMSHAARAAIEADILPKSFDRLLHDDMKVAYEAFVLIALAISAGETELVFETFKTTRDDRVRLALLHVLSIVSDERSLSELEKIDPKIHSEEVREHLKETLANIAGVGV